MLQGPNIVDFRIGAWCPTTDGSGPTQAVAITITLKELGDIVLRLKTPERVDEVIRLLKHYKEDVWPTEISDTNIRFGKNDAN